MKRMALLFTIIITGISAFSQSYQLNFAGSGESNAVDSVRIENITKGTSLTVKGSDILTLTISTGIRQLNSQKSGALDVYPNPTSDPVTIEFFAPESGLANIRVINQVGKTMVSINTNLETGLHRYLVNGLGEGMYIISVSSVSYSYTEKVISHQVPSDNPTLSLINFEPMGKTISKQKAGTVSMAYAAGDRLILSGCSGHYITKGVYVISNNQTITFNFINCTDGNNHHYPVLPIATKVWMATNLATPAYSDGTTIPYRNDTTSRSPAYTWYTYTDKSVNSTYGALYNWLTIETGKLCPTGWHVASDFEWSTLQSDLGSNPGGKLKSINEWADPNFGATNEIGFSAYPGGYCDNSFVDLSSKFKSLGLAGYWWTGTAIEGGDFAYYRAMSSESANISSYIYGANRRSKYYSVRCVKN